jgi:NAD(P)-dependent dehydrogenase (short-subunit alcohol dehydrogenase family)
MDIQLTGKRAIITGGSAGIGLAVVRKLAAEGVQVTIPGRNKDKLDRALASIQGTVHGVEADLGTRKGVEALVAQVPGTTSL